MDSNEQFLELDLKTMYWTKVEIDKNSPKPKSRDDHAYFYDSINCVLYIFGGYV